MKCFLSCAVNTDNLKENFIVELQGSLENNDCNSLSNQVFGHLFFNKDKQPLLVIGHHVLTGKIVNLDEPLLITKKSVYKSECNEESDNTVKNFIVEAIVRQKLIFNSRPRPIISNVSKIV